MDDSDKLNEFLEGLQPKVRERVEMWDPVNWEQAIGIAKMVGEGDTQYEDLKEEKDFLQETRTQGETQPWWLRKSSKKN